MRGFSLLEACIASAVLAGACLSFILSLVYADRAATLSSLQLTAAHTLQGESERIRADSYDNVNAVHYNDVTTTSSRRIYLDAEERVPATLSYDILSTFPVVKAWSTGLRVKNIPVNQLRQGSFVPNELTSSTLVICSGSGVTQRALIKSNTADAIEITTDLTGKKDQSWDVMPDSSSIVQLNMGKLITMRLSYVLWGRKHQEEMRTLVVLPLGL